MRCSGFFIADEKLASDKKESFKVAKLCVCPPDGKLQTSAATKVSPCKIFSWMSAGICAVQDNVTATLPLSTNNSLPLSKENNWLPVSTIGSPPVYFLMLAISSAIIVCLIFSVFRLEKNVKSAGDTKMRLNY